MTERRWTDIQLTEALATSRSIAEVLKKLSLRPVGGNYQTIKNRIRELGLDNSHLTGQAWSRGQKVVCKPHRSLAEVLVEDVQIKTSSLKSRLFREGIFEKKCYRCGLHEWLGQEIPLELEHINGNTRDNRLSNLTILCPNCHALTPTYRRQKAPVVE